MARAHQGAGPSLPRFAADSGRRRAACLNQSTRLDSGRRSNGPGKAARHADVMLSAVKGFSWAPRSSKSARAALAICSFRSR
jgi:hypothetical protein